MLNGALLLGMSKDEMRTVCPEEGGRVFFQLQAIKSSIAVSDSSIDAHAHTTQITQPKIIADLLRVWVLLCLFFLSLTNSS